MKAYSIYRFKPECNCSEKKNRINARFTDDASACKQGAVYVKRMPIGCCFPPVEIFGYEPVKMTTESDANCLLLYLLATDKASTGATQNFENLENYTVRQT